MKINKKRSNTPRSSNARRANGRNGNKKSTLNPKLLIRKPDGKPLEDYKSEKVFSELPLHKLLAQNLKRKGYTHPTKIQEQTYEHLMQGRNLIGIANTGTGKTGSFLIPLVDQLLKNSDKNQSLIVVPTRELALQVEKELNSLINGTSLRGASFIGGTSVSRSMSLLKRRNDIIIGTPGRLMDMIDRRALRLERISNLVLDEFDRMLDMGFVEEIKKMVALMKHRKQTMLFSATIDKKQSGIINKMIDDPVTIKVSNGSSTADQIEQDIIQVPKGDDKFNLLLKLIKHDEFKKVLLFIETKRSVDKVSKKLKQSGVKTEMIHGNKSQNYRISALDKFKKGNIQVLVATDVAARGIDVTNVTHVINYQVPQTMDSYIHRIGRTGRAGKTGKAYTFVD
jgi:ATP-dependent RNA helicase RhlE